MQQVADLYIERLAGVQQRGVRRRQDRIISVAKSISFPGAEGPVQVFKVSYIAEVNRCARMRLVAEQCIRKKRLGVRQACVLRIGQGGNVLPDEVEGKGLGHL